MKRIITVFKQERFVCEIHFQLIVVRIPFMIWLIFSLANIHNSEFTRNGQLKICPSIAFVSLFSIVSLKSVNHKLRMNTFESIRCESHLSLNF